MGILISGVTLSIGELSALIPLSGGVIRPAAYFVDPAFSFAQGWNVTYQYLISIPAEISAAAVIVQFWVTINNAIWVTIFSAILFASNIFLVRIYGEVEFTFAILKVCLVVGMNIMVLDSSLNSFDYGMLICPGHCTHRRRRPRSPSHRL